MKGINGKRPIKKTFLFHQNRIQPLNTQLDSLLADLTSGDDNRAEKTVPLFPAHGQDAVKALEKLLDEKESDTRWWAIRALAVFKEIDVSGLLHRGLKDTDPSVAQCAALSLRENPSPDAIPDLIELLSHEDRLLARLAADALIAAGTEATQALIEVVKEDQQTARLEAVRALAAIGDQDSIGTLFKLLEEDSTLMKYWAEEGLDKMGIGMVFFDPGK